MSNPKLLNRKCFQFLSYDVWGNAKDGWEVNDVTSMGLFIVVDNIDELGSDTFRRAAQKLVMRPRFQVRLEWLDDTMVEITRPNDYPLGRFEAVELERVQGKWGIPGSYRDAQVLRITKTGRTINETGKW